MKRYVKQQLSDEEIKDLINTEVLDYISDAGLITALRRILFYDKNKIDWQDAYAELVYQMPELKK